MTVKELIGKLQDFDENLKVKLYGCGDYYLADSVSFVEGQKDSITID